MPSPAIETYRALARYNRRANAALYEACARLELADYLAPRPCYFGSIHNTLNHLLVCDRLWLGRLWDQPHGITALDQILHDTLPALQIDREREDDAIIAFVDALTDRDLLSDVTWSPLAGGRETHALGHLLTHIFNHQTHHRGQVHCLLSQTDVPPPAIDFLE